MRLSQALSSSALSRLPPTAFRTCPALIMLSPVPCKMGGIHKTEANLLCLNSSINKTHTPCDHLSLTRRDRLSHTSSSCSSSLSSDSRPFRKSPVTSLLSSIRPAHSPITHANNLPDEEEGSTFQKASYPSGSSLAGSQSSAFSAPRSRGLTSPSSSLSVSDDRQGYDSRLFGAFSPPSSATVPDYRSRMSHGDIHRPPNADTGRQRASSVAATGYGDLSLEMGAMHLTPQPFSAYGSYPGSRPPAGRSFEEE